MSNTKVIKSNQNIFKVFIWQLKVSATTSQDKIKYFSVFLKMIRKNLNYKYFDLENLYVNFDIIIKDNLNRKIVFLSYQYIQCK